MKTLFYFIIFAGIIFWPQVQSPAQSPDSTSSAKKEYPPAIDSISILNKLSRQKSDSISIELNRIANRKPHYITRTHIRKVNHLKIDTVTVFIDTCFNPPQMDTVYLAPVTNPATKKQNWIQKLFNHKKPRPNYLKVVSP